MQTERRALGLVLAGIVLIGGAALAAWFFANFERTTLEVPMGASAAARRNPFLAAERFLARVGIAAESRAGRDLLRHPPSASDTLVVNGLGLLDAQRREALRGWIAAGGHLVAKATETWEDDPPPDDLLGALGVRLESVDPEKNNADCDSELLAQVVDEPGHKPLQVAFSPCLALALVDTEGTAVTVDGHPRLVRIPLGDGHLTVVGDNDFMTNAAIGHHDHARYLAELVRPPSGGKVWLLYDSSLPWLGALLWAAVPGGMAAATVLILVWMWSLGARLGPRAPPPDRRRRDLIEHLEASGRFQWRHGRAADLVEPTRKRVLAAWQRRRPDLRGLGPAEQAAVIAAGTGESADAVTAALLAQADDPRELIVQARQLQGLWRGARPHRQARQRAGQTHTQVPNEGDG